jgi:hypothetical protein
VAADNSICLYDMEKGVCVFRAAGHAHTVSVSQSSGGSAGLVGPKPRMDPGCCPPAACSLGPPAAQHVRWLPVDDFMVAECSNGAIYIWQLSSSHLESTAAGQVRQLALLPLPYVSRVVTPGDCNAASPEADNLEALWLCRSPGILCKPRASHPGPKLSITRWHRWW